MPLDSSFRKHRYHTIHEINTGSPFQCFPVQCTVFLHVIRHNRYVYAQFVSVFRLCQGNGIIQILLRLRRRWSHTSDGADFFRKSHRPVISVKSCRPAAALWQETPWAAHNFWRPRVHRFPDRCFSLILFYASFRTFIPASVAGDLHNDLITVLCIHSMLLRNKDILLHFCVVRDDKPVMPAFSRMCRQLL